MRTIGSSILSLLSILTVSLCFLSCNPKDDDATPIQQADSLVDISVSYSETHALAIHYNNIVYAPINLSLVFYLSDKSQQKVQCTIPSGNEDVQKFGTPDSDDYLNVWFYHSNNGDSLISWNADVDSFKIETVSCPDSHYGFTVVADDGPWHYYHPTGARSLLSFIANQDTVVYTDYSLGSSVTRYNAVASVYSFSLFGYGAYLVSGEASYPFRQGDSMSIPFMNYYWNGETKGSANGAPQQIQNGSTVSLTITKVTDSTYDATFSGKLWSSVQPDTIFVTNGIIRNAALPVQQ